MRRKLCVTILTCGALAAPLLSQEAPPPCPLHAEHQKDAAALDQRGDATMGFEHTRTTHHFFLKEDGGVIQVEANDPGDAASVAKIRGHLAEVARAFSAGDFAMPGHIHDRVLPGVPEMTRLAKAIQYPLVQPHWVFVQIHWVAGRRDFYWGQGHCLQAAKRDRPAPP